MTRVPNRRACDCVSVFAARTIQYGIGQRHLIGNAPGVSSRSRRTPRTSLVGALLSVAVFVPLLFITYEALALVEHTLGLS